MWEDKNPGRATWYFPAKPAPESHRGAGKFAINRGSMLSIRICTYNCKNYFSAENAGYSKPAREKKALAKTINSVAADILCLQEVGFDRMWMEEHLKHCLRRIRAEVDEETFTAFQHYVIDEWNADRVCETLNISRNKLYKIKWRVTERLREKMHRLIDGEKSVS